MGTGRISDPSRGNRRAICTARGTIEDAMANSLFRCRPAHAIFASNYSHCLYDLLLRSVSGELPGSISLVISNHLTCKPCRNELASRSTSFPIRSENKQEQEQKELELLAANQTDLIVLARYMQVLGPEFASRYPNRIINIHHSFLPAFVGIASVPPGV